MILQIKRKKEKIRREKRERKGEKRKKSRKWEFQIISIDIINKELNRRTRNSFRKYYLFTFLSDFAWMKFINSSHFSIDKLYIYASQNILLPKINFGILHKLPCCLAYSLPAHCSQNIFVGLSELKIPLDCFKWPFFLNSYLILTFPFLTLPLEFTQVCNRKEEEEEEEEELS